MKQLRVLRPIQSIEEVQASLDTFGDRIADKLDGRRASRGGEVDAHGATFSYREVFADLGEDLESLREKVVAADDEHTHRQARQSALGRQAVELGDELYDHQVSARRILGGAYEPDQSFELAAVSGITPRTFKPLEEQVDQTVKLLRAPVIEVPAVMLDGVDIDLGDVAGGLETSLRTFRVKRRDLDRARKAVGESKVLLDRTLAEFQGTFPWIAQALESFARMAGESELAERIRTSIRRVTRRQGEDEEEAPDEASTDEASSDETSSDETASDETSTDETSTDETASDETASDETASDGTTSDETASTEPSDTTSTPVEA